MAVKTTGAEFKRFYSDEKYWPEKSDTYHDDEIFRVNGDQVDDDFDMTKVPDNASIEIEGGIVMNSPLYKQGKEPSVEAYFKRWKKEQTVTTIAVECDVSKLKAIKAAVRAAGGKVL